MKSENKKQIRPTLLDLDIYDSTEFPYCRVEVVRSAITAIKNTIHSI